MNRTNTIIAILLVLALVIGIVNLKIINDMRSQNSQQVANGIVPPAPTDEIKNVSGTFVSTSGNSLVANILGKNVSLVLGSNMKYYIREIMSDAKYQKAFAASQVPQKPKQVAGDATGGVYEIPVAPVQDIFRQVKALPDLGLKGGDLVDVAFVGDLTNGETILQVVKVVHI